MTRIVILGGGYAGIATALGLDGVEAEVTLINQHSYHHLTTLLHQPVVGRRNYQELSVPIQKLFRRNTHFLRGAVDTIDTATKKIDIRIRIVEALPRILNGLDPYLGDKAAQYLTKKKVEIWTGAHIAGVDGRGLALSDGRRIEGGTIIWTGGVRGSALLEKNGFAVNRQGRAEVDSFLQASGREDVFIIGDCASARDASGKLLPPPPPSWRSNRDSGRRGTYRRDCGTRYTALPRQGSGHHHFSGEALRRRGRDRSSDLRTERRLSRGCDRLSTYLMGIGGPGLALRKWWEWGPYTAALRRD